ncbi:hypothetical protein ASPZODRAFT_1392365 [Penicilliopsis zonata CBS 506.65]|uniref:Cns1/TTC4 wheel domain-containing protein n=1 Tax=Penicilliopsis zonata CBS 506.65 TaxID=1073090 RepID=A0A1L9SPP7_9EURO|nr:hypothetical protein ASPZODRAFT_1392365 [Penicilliopsis zonata CBS 506.65]OJJ49071.1 hypothetical protein ASPZODRAFT_1392365 [Penicilliopsis zonata CBS 506.65]
MGQIEELPDDFDEALDLNKKAPANPATAEADEPFQSVISHLPPSGLKDIVGLQQPQDEYLPPSDEVPFPINFEKLKELQNDPTAPHMPPAMASVKSHTAAELMDMMNKTPLFMTDLENAGDEKGENVLLDALRALQNEGTRGEVAQNFREQGNEAAREKRWIDAKEFYTKSITVVMAKTDQWEKPEDAEKEKKMLREAEEASYINRALCNLELKNYRSTTLDCASALKLNPKNIKAFYRSATALLALDKPNNKPLQQVAVKIAARKEVLERIAARKRAEEEKSRKENMVLSAALKARQIRTRKTEQPPDMEDAKICLVPDPLSPESSLDFPTVLLYPMDAQSDFIKAFSEMHSIADHLEYIFPLPWDRKGEYTINGVECFMETVTGGLIKAGKKVPLLKILSGGKTEVVDEMVRIMNRHILLLSPQHSLTPQGSMREPDTIHVY